MAQRYKLRLGDGAIHMVDADGLRPWLEDGGAMVQIPGSYRWSPLREFLAGEAALPIVPPQPPEDEMAPGLTDPSPGDRLEGPADPVPIIRFKPLDDREEEPASEGGGSEVVEDHGLEAVPHQPWRDRLGQTLLPVAAALGTLLSRSLDRLKARLERLRPLVPPEAPAASSAASPAPSEPLRPPPPIGEPPVLRFVDVPEPREAEDFYEGDDESEEGVSPFQAAWLWTKPRLVIVGLVASGILVVITWRTWLPKVARLGQMMFTEVDRHVRPPEETEEQQRARLVATQELPQLAPETIRLLLSSGPGGVLDPPEMFQLAGDAADRGRSALTLGEAKELKALQRELVRTLRPAERRRVREYDRARSRRVVYTFENRRALELSARGARALPPRSRERLQFLLGKAISAGLDRPVEVAPWDMSRR